MTRLLWLCFPAAVVGLTGALWGNEPLNPEPPKPERVVNSIGMPFVRIPEGECVMGTSKDDFAASMKGPQRLFEWSTEEECPQHKIKISRSFQAGVFEVTQAEFRTVMGVNPSWFCVSGKGSEKVAGIDTDNFPVEHLSWYDAIEFCNKLSELENLSPVYNLKSVRRSGGRINSAKVSLANPQGDSDPKSGYRLPTEAEWEYMCRAGTSTPYSFGNALNGDNANVNGKEPFGTPEPGPSLDRTAAVGSYKPNQFGLHDCHGNVFEWCFDSYDENLYASRKGTVLDPVCTANLGLNAMRGGSWDNGPEFARSSSRSSWLPDDRLIFVGLRVVR